MGLTMGEAMTKAIYALTAALLVLGTILWYNTWRFAAPRPSPSAAADKHAIRIAPADSAAMVERFSRALQLATVSRETARRDTPVFQEFLQFLRESFPRVFSRMQEERVNELSVLLHWKGDSDTLRPLLFVAHYDVVPVDSSTIHLWTYPPFSGTIAGGYVWGRGAIDDKAGTMLTLEAMEYLLAGGFRPRRSIYIALGHDEEIGGLEGAREMARRLDQQGREFELVLDEGGTVLTEGLAGISRPVALVGIAEKGYVTLRLTARGEAGHSSMPPRQTAIGRLAAAIQRLETQPFPAAITGPTKAFFDTVGPHMPFLPRLVLANRWLLGSLLMAQLERQPPTNALIRTTTAVTMIQGGVKPNVLPAQATALVNFRIRPGESVETVIKHVRSAIADTSIGIEIFGKLAIDPSPTSRIDNRAFRQVSQSIRTVFPGTLAAPYTVLGATDSRYYYSVSRAVYRFLPLEVRYDDLSRIHGVNERVATAGLIKGVRFYIDLIRRLNP